MNEIMFATNFSERSDRVLRRAVILARARDAVWRFLGSVARQVLKDARCDVLEAHVRACALRSGKSHINLARETGHSRPRIRARIPLVFLAPRIQAAILDGRQPVHLSVALLIREDIPMDWAEQVQLFEIG